MAADGLLVPGSAQDAFPRHRPFDDVGVARRKADSARESVAEALDPSQQRKAQRVVYATAREAKERQQQGLPPVDSFEVAAREWFEVNRGGWVKGYAD